jgi:hypothetical protein
MLLNQENDILTVDDLCEVLRIGKNAAYKLINSGKISIKFASIQISFLFMDGFLNSFGSTSIIIFLDSFANLS